ncbi:MAG: substrate-binding domain-containing protein [Desulfuromonadales bacterium]|nr:substrate-binding domain-containing protein [Desulfuromonadales bacterium]
MFCSVSNKAWSATLTLLLLIMVFSAVSTWGGQDTHGDLSRPPAFSDPDNTVAMTPEWIARPVKHAAAISADVAVVVSFQLADIWEPWFKQFARQKGVNIHIRNGTDGTSAGALRRKEVDIACFCGSPTNTDRMPGVEFHTVGVVPVVFYANVSNKLDDLSMENVVKVFRGEITNWSELGGEVMNIVPVARSHCKKRCGRWRPLNNMDNLSPTTIKVGSIEDALDYVAATPGSIGYEVLTRVDSYVKRGEIKVLSVGQMNPYDLESLGTGEYPFYRSYSFTTWTGAGLENPLASGIIDMLVKKTEEKAGEIFFVPTVELRKSGWQFRGNELVGEPAE